MESQCQNCQFWRQEKQADGSADETGSCIRNAPSPRFEEEKKSLFVVWPKTLAWEVCGEHQSVEANQSSAGTSSLIASARAVGEFKCKSCGLTAHLFFGVHFKNQDQPTCPYCGEYLTLSHWIKNNLVQS